jgi:hypothetical protein
VFLVRKNETEGESVEFYNSVRGKIEGYRMESFNWEEVKKRRKSQVEKPLGGRREEREKT